MAVSGSKFKGYLGLGILLITIGIIINLSTMLVPNFSPRSTVRSYIQALKNGDVDVLRRIGPVDPINNSIRMLGEEYLKKVKLADSVYLKNGFEIWVLIFEKIWKMGVEKNPVLEQEKQFEQIARIGFELLSDEEKKKAVDFKNFILNDYELPDLTLSRNNLMHDFAWYVQKNKISYRIALGKFTSSKIILIEKFAEENTNEEYLNLAKSDKEEIINESDFINRKGEQLLRNRLKEKYGAFSIDLIDCVFSNTEFKGKPFLGNEAYVLVNNRNTSLSGTFFLRKGGLFWKISEIPGNTL